MKLRNIWKALCLSSAALASVCAFSIPAQAARQYSNCISNCKVYDEGDLLTDEEEAQINQLLAETSDAVDMYVAIAFYGVDSDFYSDYEIQVKADDTFDELFNVEPTVASDGLLLLVDYSRRYIYITTCGMGEMYYYNGAEDDRISVMNSHLHAPTAAENYVGIADQFCRDVKEFYEEGIPKNAYTYNSDTGMYLYSKNGELISADKLPKTFGFKWGMWIGIGLVVGFFPALIVLCSALIRYKKKFPLSATAYASERDAQFRVKEDLFLRENTTRVNISDDDRGGGGGGGGGGGSSHSSGGGFSHGGGGSHF